jgi:ubiquinone/menaquinone biosynthesis C-methylase UbiE
LRVCAAEDIMNPSDNDKTRETWDRIAADWDIQVGDDGDSNRILNSDPVLWAFAGDVAGLAVLDAGCGTGYLSRKLREKGAKVIGVDFSEKMIAIARGKAPDIDFRVDSCSELATVADGSVDMLIANYVLMDCEDLEGATGSFSRVLKAGGTAITIFSHPCFPGGRCKTSEDARSVDYHWDSPYFERNKCVDPPWGHFKSDFIWFHRPLSDYWKAFKAAGFEVTDFEEPRITEDRYHLAANERKLTRSKYLPWSVAFKLRKI